MPRTASRLITVGAVVTASLAGTTAWWAVPAAAASGSSFTVAGGPTSDLNLPPGQPVSAQYTVINTSAQSEQIAVDITGLHFQGQTPEFTGSPSPGLSISARPTAITLAAGASQSVNLTAEALPGSNPGGLYAGIVFKELPPPSAGSATIEEAQARPLIGHVPGPTTDTGQIVAFASPTATAHPGRVVFNLTFLDTGTIDYLLGGSMTVVDSSGAVLGSVPMPQATVLPGNQRTVPVTYSGSAPAGQLTGQLHLTWGTKEEHNGTAMATVIVSGATPGQSNPTSPGGVGPAGHQNLTILTHHQRHAVDWIFDGLALLLLLLLLALLIWRYLQRRRTARRLKREAEAARA